MVSVTLNQLIQERATFHVDTNVIGDFDELFHDEDTIAITAKLEEMNLEHLIDEENYEDNQSFATLANQMENITVDGKIKKKILRPGSGESPTNYSTVKIHYDAYLEFNEEPFDSTYKRNRPRKFVVNDGEVLLGLDLGVQSMKLHEKAQFLVDCDYAYGRNSLIGNIPPNSTILFEIELLEIIDTGTIVLFNKLPEHEKFVFSKAYNYCLALSDKGKKYIAMKDLGNKKKSKNDEDEILDLSPAIKDYNMAVTRLEKLSPEDKDDIRKQRELLFKLSSNLLVCYTRTKQWKKGCDQAKKIFELSKNSQYISISAKVFFNYAKCLRMLNDYENAKLFLNKAYKMEPKNVSIAEEMLGLEKDVSDQKEKEKVIVQALLKKSNK